MYMYVSVRMDGERSLYRFVSVLCSRTLNHVCSLFYVFMYMCIIVYALVYTSRYARHVWVITA